MLRITTCRLDELRSKYPPYRRQVVIEHEGAHRLQQWIVTLTNPLSLAWWHDLAEIGDPFYAGWRLRRLRQLVTPVEVLHASEELVWAPAFEPSAIDAMFREDVEPLRLD